MLKIVLPEGRTIARSRSGQIAGTGAISQDVARNLFAITEQIEVKLPGVIF